MTAIVHLLSLFNDRDLLKIFNQTTYLISYYVSESLSVMGIADILFYPDSVHYHIL